MTTEPTSSGGSETQPSGTPATGNASSGATPPAATLTLEDALKRIAELEHSHKNAREQADRQAKTLSKYEQEKKDAELAKLSETEKLAAQHNDLKSKYDSDVSALTERIVRYEVERQASKLGIVDPDAAAKLIDWSALDYDDDGTPTNAETLLKDLLKARPWLASTQQGKTPASSGGATNPSRTSAGNAGQLSWDAISKMTSEQYNARRSEIMTWMTQNPPKRF